MVTSLTKPAHKSGTAGQIVNEIPEAMRVTWPTRPTRNPESGVLPQTLGDVITSMEKPKKSFEDWLTSRFGNFEDWEGNLSYTDLSACWRAAQENK